MKYISIFIMVLVCFTAKTQVSLPDGFLIRWHDQDYKQPIDIKFDAEGSMYVLEKEGRLWVEKNGIRTEEPIIDISDEVGNYGDMGSLGFCLHPKFLENGFFYLFYVVDRYHLLNSESASYDPSESINYKATIGRISRYQADSTTDFETVVPQSRFILLGETKETGIPYLHNSHAGGGILFAKDGTMIISTGDGSTWKDAYAGNGPPYFDEYVVDGLNDGIIKEKEEIGSFRSQMIDNLNGKLLRIDPMTGLGVNSNPYFDASDPDAARSKVWSLGLRNPFRTIMRPNRGSENPDDALPGVFIVGDVGGGAWEDLNINRKSGINYGWPIYEGHRINQKYADQLTINLDAPNPLFQEDGCEQEFFYFQDLIKEEKSIGPLRFYANPCNLSIAIPEEFIWEHKRPDVAVAREGGGKGFRVSVFNQEGDPEEKIIGDPSVPIDGDSFDYFGSCAIAGGFYEAKSFPENYWDKLFFADYTGGWIKVFGLNEGDEVVSVEDFFSDTIKISHVELNPHDGSLYFVDYPNGIKIISYGENVPPIAKIRTDSNFGPAPLDLQLIGDESYDPNGDSISFKWEFSDGTESNFMNPSYIFDTNESGPQQEKVYLTVSDTEGLTDVEEMTISLNNTPPKVEISSFQDGDSYPISGISYLPLYAEVIDAEHEADELSYEWQIFFGHNTHEHPEPSIYNASSQLKIYPEICGGNVYYYRIKVIVTDAHGLQGEDQKTIYPDCSNSFIDLVEFTASKNNNTVDLNWLTATEFELKQFEIERSINGAEFISIHTQTPLNINGLNYYNAVDQRPSTGMNTYRLKITHQDETIVYSDDVIINFDINIYPNPVQDVLHIVFADEKTRAHIKYMKQSGKRIYKESFNVDSNEEKAIDLSHVPSGAYFYEIVVAGKKHSGNFVIIH